MATSSSLELLLSDEIAPLFWRPKRTHSAWSGHVAFAHWLIRVTRPELFVELGTHSGISYSAFCEAVKWAGLETHCFAVDTWKGDKHAGFYPEEVFEDFRKFHDENFESFSKILRTTFDEAVNEFGDKTIDIIHIDGLHTYEAVRHDFETWLPKLSERAVALFHDTNERREDFGVWRLWSELQQRYPSFEFLHSHGLGIICVGSRPPAEVMALCSLDTADLVTRIRDRFESTSANWSSAEKLLNLEKASAHEIALRDTRILEQQKANEARKLEQQKANEILETMLASVTVEKETLRLELDEKASAVDAFARDLESLNMQLSRAISERDLARTEELRSRNLVRAIYTSTSWRATSPIRTIKTTTGQLLTAGVYAFSLLKERRLSLSAIRRGIRRLPSIIREGKLARPIDLPGLLETFGPDDASRIFGAFDSDFYLRNNADVAAANIDPFRHFMTHGWKEHRDPSPHFSVSYYLRRYRDIERSGINPFIHYVLHGQREKRSSLPRRKRLERMDFRPKVSVIVPNYNHARFLDQRIESILCQTYDNTEVLILDDCSSDDSRQIIRRYCEQFPGRVRALFNEQNSGNVFRQWRKGIENSDGDLIWICESDDFCEPDFLENLVPYFRDRSTNIAFGRIQFSDAKGKLQSGLDQYREGAEAGIWNESIVRPARQWFANGFGVNNVIANVGGCVWRRQALPVSVWEEAETFSVAGDWFLYCHLAGGGQIAYEPSAVAYFRQHGDNTSVTSFGKPGYYIEHHRLMALLRKTWGVPVETVEKFFSKVDFQYRHFKLEKKLGPLSQFLDRDELLTFERERPHILMAFLGFHPGGGEVFPINLANELHRQGYLVSMLALDMSHVNEHMLRSLDTGIPVYDGDWIADLGAHRFVEEAGISLIHSHMASLEVFFFCEAGLGTRVPYLVSLHGSYESSMLPTEMLRQITESVSHWVYTAERNLEPFHSVGMSEAKRSKLGNGMPLDLEPFPSTRDQLGIPEDAVVFTLVARGILRKGWRASIDAFRRVRDRHPERKLHLLLCGDGEQAERHQQLHGSDTDLTFLGYQSRIHGLYRISDVAIVPSRFEGESFPLCIIQAMQVGTPIIATRVGEIKNMIAPPGFAPAGILIDPVRNTDDFIEILADAMSSMLDDEVRGIYASSSSLLGENYGIETVAKSYMAIYQRLESAHQAE